MNRQKIFLAKLFFAKIYFTENIFNIKHFRFKKKHSPSEKNPKIDGSYCFNQISLADTKRKKKVSLAKKKGATLIQVLDIPNSYL
jgi:hypothetical protein